MREPLSKAFLDTRKDPVVVASYMRSGTHLTIDFLRRNFPAFSTRKLPLEANDSLYLPVDALIARAWSAGRARRVIARAERVICKTHWCDPDFRNLIASEFPPVGEWLRERSRVILVHRHPRKAIESLVVWRMFTGEFDRPEVPEGVWLADRLHEWVARIRRWQHTPRPLLVISSDIMLREPETALSMFAQFLEAEPQPAQRLLPQQLRGSWHSRLNRMFATRPESTEMLTLRPAPQIRWTDAQLELVEEICGPLCRELGYR